MGTHFDAPSHFSKTGWRLHEVPIDKMMGPGVVVDVKSKAAKNRDYAVSVDDLLKWESKYGRIPDKAVVVMNSGWDRYWGNVNLAFGTDMFNDTMSYHFPGWHVDSVQWLITNRNINILGVDTPSTDPAQEHKYPVHVLASAHSIVMLESIANLDDIPASGAMIYAPVAKYYEGSGAPVRVFASVNDDVSSSNKFQTNVLTFTLVIAPIIFR
ncbi:hypothetical protein KUTeg_001869 [Tegillarca granosa]|uniref:Kynurenine formamidase n=1 Tax=Tegillarca granosa TaxID=220873 RepID=A0ABQ9FU60_TEGGR|nr:hypothetical protein KUTeg_001869 [Tegillarca granosa]